MTTRLDQDGAQHLRKLSLSVAEIKTLEMLVAAGGEAPIVFGALKPLSQAVITKMGHDGLIELRVIDPLALTPRTMLRLTDQGRRVAEYVEQMSVAPKVKAESINL